jgi:hypothetical protein
MVDDVQAWGVRAESAPRDPVRLYVLFGAWLLHGDAEVILAGGHAVWDKQQQYQPLWQQVSRARLGSALLEQRARELINALDANLRTALEYFTERLEALT